MAKKFVFPEAIAEWANHKCEMDNKERFRFMVEDGIVLSQDRVMMIFPKQDLAPFERKDLHGETFFSRKYLKIALILLDSIVSFKSFATGNPLYMFDSHLIVAIAPQVEVEEQEAKP